MSKEQIFQLFLKDMKQPALQFAAHTSFQRYAQMRDQLIRDYSRISRIPEEEFHSQIAMEMVDFRTV